MMCSSQDYLRNAWVSRILRLEASCSYQDYPGNPWILRLEGSHDVFIPGLSQEGLGILGIPGYSDQRGSRCVHPRIIPGVSRYPGYLAQRRFTMCSSQDYPRSVWVSQESQDTQTSDVSRCVRPRSIPGVSWKSQDTQTRGLTICSSQECPKCPGNSRVLRVGVSLDVFIPLRSQGILGSECNGTWPANLSVNGVVQYVV